MISNCEGIVRVSRLMGHASQSCAFTLHANIYRPPKTFGVYDTAAGSPQEIAVRHVD